MALIKFIKASEKPLTWLSDAIYFIKNNGYAESYVTSMDGVPEEIGNTDMIKEVIADTPSSRFGIEDNTSTVNRTMSMQLHDFTIQNANNLFLRGKIEVGGWVPGIDITGTQVDIYSKQDTGTVSLKVTATDASLSRPGKPVSSLATLADVQKNVANGYAGLDENGLVPAAILPSYVDDVQEYSTLGSFPATGTSGIIYVATDSNKTYRWSGSGYIEISPSPGSTDSIPEGSVNLYYRDSRVNSVLTAWPGSTNINTVGTITAGVWGGTPIQDNFIAGATKWNNKQNALGFTPEDASRKGAADGYAPLDGAAKIPAAYLPAYVDDVQEFGTFGSFPGTGIQGIIYVALDTGKIYRWSGSAYVEISPSPGSTDAVPEGSINKYYTDARVDTRLTTWQGNTAINKVGTIGTGTWQGTAITDAYISSAATWNNKADKTVTTNVQNASTLSYPIVLSDAGKLIVMNVSGVSSVIISPNSSTPFALGTLIHVIAIGAGAVAISPGSGVTLNSADGALNLRTIYSTATLFKAGTDTWYVWGDLI